LPGKKSRMTRFNTFYTQMHKRLHYIYLLYAVPMVILATVLIPPFQNPDEPNHFSRVEQVSRGEFIPDFHYVKGTDKSVRLKESDSTVLYPKPGGFKTDQGVVISASLFSAIQAHYEVKISDTMYKKASLVKWGTGVTYYNFGNTAIYMPLVYFMPALGVIVGKQLNISVVKTLFISRILNGAFAIALSFIALILAKRSKILLFTVLLFPMVIELFSSVSQDALLISCSFLLVAIIDQSEFGEKPRYQKRHIYAMIILMSIIGMAKPPYAICSVIFLFLSLSPKSKIALIAIPFLAIATWLYLDRINLSVIFAPPILHINAKLQILHILQHPLRFVEMFFDVDQRAIIFNYKSFVGILGWLDADFPTLYYRFSFLILLTGFIIFAPSKKDERFKLRGVLLLAVVTSIIAVMSVQYITWAKLDSPVLSGMQGRYLLPIFPFLALGLTSSKESAQPYKLKAVATYLILTFPLFTCLAFLKVVLSRYY
jgi:uncharacterized membrane protein